MPSPRPFLHLLLAPARRTLCLTTSLPPRPLIRAYSAVSPALRCETQQWPRKQQGQRPGTQHAQHGPSRKAAVRCLGTTTSTKEEQEAREGGGGVSTSTTTMMMPPINIAKWVSQNAHLLQPPVNNHIVYSTRHLTLMLVGGPNARTDYHINSTPEWFYQHKGSMLLKIVDPANNNTFRDIPIHQGDMFLLPAYVPHNPVRFADTVGVVLELPREHGKLDRLRWYCAACEAVVYEEAFECTDLGTQIKEVVQRFAKDERARTCKACGTVCATAPGKG